MRKLILNISVVLLLLFCTNVLFGQNTATLSSYSKKGKKSIMFSVEPFFYYPYYFLHSNPYIYNKNVNYKNYWNCGGGILIFNHIGKLRVSTGLYLSTKNYYRNNKTDTLIDKIYYRNFPIIFSINSINKFRPFIGFIINWPYHYNNSNNTQLMQEIGDSASFSHHHFNLHGITLPHPDFLTGFTLEMGCSYKVKVINRFQINIKIFGDYKLKQDVGFLYNYMNKDILISIASSRLMIGLGLSCEIFSNKHYQK